ncbi:hypothetical protein TNCV_4191581 [Trichonephila clavipes]|nr:hypothetical protein TNCV_4191581 [Trichonephila clavipes]
MSTLFHSPPNENLTYTSLHDTTPFNSTREKRKEELHTNTESIVCDGLFLEPDYPEGEEEWGLCREKDSQMGWSEMDPFFPMPVQKLKETPVQCAFVFSRICDDSASEKIELAQTDSRNKQPTDKRSKMGTRRLRNEMFKRREYEDQILTGENPIEASLSDRLASQRYSSPRIKVDFEPRSFRISNRTAYIEKASSTKIGVELPRVNCGPL